MGSDRLSSASQSSSGKIGLVLHLPNDYPTHDPTAPCSTRRHQRYQNMQYSIVCRGACQTTITTHPAQPAETRRQETGSRSSLLSIPQSAKTPKRDSSGSHMNASLLGKARLFDHQPGWRFCGSFERTVRDVYYRIDSMNCLVKSVCQQGACCRRRGGGMEGEGVGRTYV